MCSCVLVEATSADEAHVRAHVTVVDTLQHTATHCNTLQHTATHCNTLQHNAAQGRSKSTKMLMKLMKGLILADALQTHCNTHTLCATLHHTTPHCNTLQHKVEARNFDETYERAHVIRLPHMEGSALGGGW